MCWYKEGPGAVGSPEKGGFIPSAKTGGKREDFKYGEYRQERMFGTEIADKSSDKKMDFMRALWGYARTDARPAFKEVERFGQIATMLPILFHELFKVTVRAGHADEDRPAFVLTALEAVRQRQVILDWMR